MFCKAEQSSLLRPIHRQAGKDELLAGQSGRLATVEDSRNNVWREIVQPENPGNESRLSAKGLMKEEGDITYREDIPKFIASFAV